MEPQPLYKLKGEFFKTLGLLAFDATRTSASDVDYPVDAVLYRTDTFRIQEQRFTGEDLVPLRQFWQSAISQAVEDAEPTTRHLFVLESGRVSMMRTRSPTLQSFVSS